MALSLSQHRSWQHAWGDLRARRLGFVVVVIALIPGLFVLAPAWAHLMPGVPQGIPAFLGTTLLAGAYGRLLWGWKCPRCAQPFGGWIGNPWPSKCQYCALEDFAAIESVQSEYQVQPVRGGALLNPRIRLGVASLEILSGVFVIGIAGWFITKSAVTWLVFAFESIGLFSVFAGVLLWRDRQLGYELSELLQLLQVVRFQFVAFSLVIATGPELLFLWAENGPGWYVGLKATVVLGRPAVEVSYIGLNVAAILLYHLIRKGRLHAQALERHHLLVDAAGEERVASSA